jgi:hypothetical protein
VNLLILSKKSKKVRFSSGMSVDTLKRELSADWRIVEIDLESEGYTRQVIEVIKSQLNFEFLLLATSVTDNGELRRKFGLSYLVKIDLSEPDIVSCIQEQATYLRHNKSKISNCRPCNGLKIPVENFEFETQRDYEKYKLLDHPRQGVDKPDTLNEITRVIDKYKVRMIDPRPRYVEKKAIAFQDAKERLFFPSETRNAHGNFPSDSSAKCALESRFRFGIRYDASEHFDVMKAKNEYFVINLVDCTGSKTEETTRHVNIYPNGNFRA